MSFSLNSVVCGDAFTVLPTFPDGCVDMVMFSPPYWGLRDYGNEPQVFGDSNCEHEWFSDDTRFGNMGGGSTKKEVTPNYRDNLPERNFCVKCGVWKGCFGLEPHPQMFIDHMVQLCRLLRRVLKKTGSLYLNLGDTYCGSWGGYGNRSDLTGVSQNQRGKHTQYFNRKAYQDTTKRPPTSQRFNTNWLQPKQKLLIPSRVAIALQHDGWILRNDIIWHKPNHMPSSVKDRLTSSYEHIYHFVQARRYYYDLDAIRQPPVEYELKRRLREKKQGLVTRFKNQKMDNLIAPPNQKSGLRTNVKTDTYLLKGKNPGDTLTADFHSKKEPYSVNNPHRVRQLGFKEAQHPKGKNPADVIAKPYSVQPRDKDFVETRDLPSLEAVKNYLNYWRRKRGYTIEQVEIKLQSQAPHHWFNGESYPTKKDWLRIKQLLKFGSRFDKRMTEIFLKLAEKQDNPKGKNPSDIIKIGSHHGSSLTKGRATYYEGYPVESDLKGKNPSDFWSINTKPFPEAHFAVYPKAICEMPIKSSCPQWICKTCGKPRTRKTKTKYIQNPNSWGTRPDNIVKGKGQQSKEVGFRYTKNLNALHETVGWSDCGCNAGFDAGVVLDPMCGAGTTLLAAHKLGRKWIGIELNPSYVEMAKKRLKRECNRWLTEYS